MRTKNYSDLVRKLKSEGFTVTERNKTDIQKYLQGHTKAQTLQWFRENKVKKYIRELKKSSKSSDTAEASLAQGQLESIKSKSGKTYKDLKDIKAGKMGAGGVQKYASPRTYVTKNKWKETFLQSIEENLKPRLVGDPGLYQEIRDKVNNLSDFTDASEVTDLFADLAMYYKNVKTINGPFIRLLKFLGIANDSNMMDYLKNYNRNMI